MRDAEIPVLKAKIEAVVAAWTNPGMTGSGVGQCRVCGASPGLPLFYANEPCPELWRVARYCPACHPEVPALVAEWQQRVEAESERRAQAVRLRSYRAHAQEAFRLEIGCRYSSCWFGTFRPANESQVLAVEQIQKWAKHEPTRQRFPFVLLHGDPGVGKTHLAVAAWWQLVRKDGISTFINEGRFHHQWQLAHAAYEKHSGYRGPSPAELVDEAAEADVLIWDDLGKAALTDGWSKVIYRIVDHRYANSLPTLFTTNYPPGVLASRVEAWTADRALSGPVFKVEGASMRMAC